MEQGAEPGAAVSAPLMGRQESVGVTALRRLAAVEEEDPAASACSLDYESPDDDSGNSSMMLGSDEEWGA